MTLLDAYPLVGFLVGGPESQTVRSILRGGDAAVTTINLAEALDVAARRHGVPVAAAMDILEPILGAVLHPVQLDVSISRRAAAIRATHYSRTNRAISVADAVLLASCGEHDTIATPDPAIHEIAVHEGLRTQAFTTPGR